MLDALAPDDRTWTKASHLAAEVTAGGISALELVEATLVRIRARDPLLNSFTALTEERAHNRARALDEARARQTAWTAGWRAVRSQDGRLSRARSFPFGGVALHFIVVLGHAPVHSAQRNRRRSSKGR